jgi:hypothetical protein
MAHPVLSENRSNSFSSSSEISTKSASVQTKLYSQRQIGVGTFFGGPFTAVLLLWQNYKATGKTEHAHKTLIIGLGLCVLYATMVLLLPEGLFSSFGTGLVFPLIFALTAHRLAEVTQNERGSAEVQSVLRVVLAVLAGMAAMFALAFGLVFVLPLSL